MLLMDADCSRSKVPSDLPTELLASLKNRRIALAAGWMLLTDISGRPALGTVKEEKTTDC